MSTEKVALMSKRKFSDWSPTVINTWSSSGVIRIGVCVGTPSVPVVLRVQLLGPTPQRAVSSPVWSFADQTWSWGQLRCLRAFLLEMPFLSTVITSPSLFTWVPLGIFLRLFQSRFNSHCWCFSLLPDFFFPYFPPHILYHNICLSHL